MGWKVNPHTGDVICTIGDTPDFRIACRTIDIENHKVVDYKVEDEDKFYFILRAGRKVLVSIDVDKEQMVASFTREMTEKLKPGEYQYDVILEKKSGYRCSFITNKKFILIK